MELNQNVVKSEQLKNGQHFKTTILVAIRRFGYLKNPAPHLMYSAKCTQLNVWETMLEDEMSSCTLQRSLGRTEFGLHFLNRHWLDI